MEVNKTPQTSYSIRFQDCDPYGHLNNARYLDYFVNAREDHLKGFYGTDIYDLARIEGIGMVVTQNQISYIRSANLNEEVVVQSQIVAYDETSVVVEMHMYDKACTSLKAVLWVSVVAIDLREQKRTQWPADLYKAISDLYLEVTDPKKVRFEQRVGELLQEMKKKRAEMAV